MRAWPGSREVGGAFLPSLVEREAERAAEGRKILKFKTLVNFNFAIFGYVYVERNV
jgi:hypothetical protein